MPPAAALGLDGAGAINTFPDDIGGVTLVPGDGGIFEIRLEDELIWERKRDGGFPEITALKRMVRDRLDPGGRSDTWTGRARLPRNPASRTPWRGSAGPLVGGVRRRPVGL